MNPIHLSFQKISNGNHLCYIRDGRTYTQRRYYLHPPPPPHIENGIKKWIKMSSAAVVTDKLRHKVNGNISKMRNPRWKILSPFSRDTTPYSRETTLAETGFVSLVQKTLVTTTAFVPYQAAIKKIAVVKNP